MTKYQKYQIFLVSLNLSLFGNVNVCIYDMATKNPHDRFSKCYIDMYNGSFMVYIIFIKYVYLIELLIVSPTVLIIVLYNVFNKRNILIS